MRDRARSAKTTARREGPRSVREDHGTVSETTRCSRGRRPSSGPPRGTALGLQGLRSVRGRLAVVSGTVALQVLLGCGEGDVSGTGAWSPGTGAAAAVVSGDAGTAGAVSETGGTGGVVSETGGTVPETTGGSEGLGGGGHPTGGTEPTGGAQSGGSISTGGEPPDPFDGCDTYAGVNWMSYYAGPECREILYPVGSGQAGAVACVVDGVEVVERVTLSERFEPDPYWYRLIEIGCQPQERNDYESSGWQWWTGSPR